MDRSEQIKPLIEKGLSSRDIGKLLDINATTVVYWAKKLNIKFKLSKKENGKRPSKIDLVNQQFGFLKVTEMIQMGVEQAGSYKALCTCTNCGNKTFITKPRNLIQRLTTSCGCRIDQYKKISGSNSSQFTGYKEISGSFWKKYKRKREGKIYIGITIEEAYDLYIKQDKRCALSDLPLIFGRNEHLSETTASLDRIDSTKGYTIDNVQWVHKHINIMKNIFSQDYFIYLCRLITNENYSDTIVENNRHLSRKRIIMSNSIKVYNGNLFDYIRSEQLDTIINAANGIGVMGCGIAGAIKKYGGKKIQTEALNICRDQELLPGDIYSTTSGNLIHKGVDRIIHAITMKNPGGETSYDIIEKAFESSLLCAVSKGTYKLGCTALGTGIGCLVPTRVADIMYKIALKFIGSIDIVFVDLNEEFTKRILVLIEDSLLKGESI